MAEPQEQINFLELSEHGKRTITRHEQYAKEMYEILNIRNYLINQIHQKKLFVDKDDDCYIPVLGRPGIVYTVALFLGLDCADGPNDWSTIYKSDLESILFDELDKQDQAYDVKSVYYGRNIPEDSVMYEKAPIDTQDWILSDGLHVWLNEDETIIARYIAKLHCFLTEKLDVIKKTGRSSERHQEWIERATPQTSSNK